MKKYNCPSCSKEFAIGSKFCQHCGRNLELEIIENPMCPKCHKTFPEGSKFCDIDGSKLTSPDKLIPKCVKCGTEYSIETKFCPKDGGAVIPEALRFDINEQNISKQFNFNGTYSKASLGNRFLASLLDGLITTGFAIPSLIFYMIGMVKLQDYYNSDEAIPLFILAGFLYLIPLTYSFIKDGIGKGQSWGKKAVGLMVVYLPQNAPCSLGQSFLRNLIMVLLGLIPFIGWLIEPIIVLASENGRRLGDKVANTQVIELKIL
ncbi:RDD family protein [Flammeovirga sp. MY04]|uniref:RDD family protein n=1 Tax=Flammeovirga sp. MY04 TaxID=1191459 RepID=UPI0008064230|nr:RDD family protein [Flammeovirga sp. MY04]ANQ52763.1 RDD family protein [Flammeovirga sp. MY04]